VHPRSVVDELPQEDPGGEGAAVPVGPDVAQVGDAAVEALAQVVGQRERPHRFAHGVSGVEQSPAEDLVVGHHARGAVAEGDHAGPGERGDVDDRIGLRLGREAERVGQDQASLGIGVEHLDRLAVAGPQHVADARGVTAEHVVGQRQVRRDLHLRRHDRDEGHGPEDRGRARHVGLHRLHARRGLDRQAAGVERDALAHERDPTLRLAVGPVRQLHEARLLGRAASDAGEPAETLVDDRRAVEHLDLEPVLRGQLHGLVRERGGGEVAARGVDEVAYEADGDRGREPALDRLAHLLAALGDDRDRFERRALGRFLVVGEAVGAERQPLGQRLGGGVAGRAVERAESVDHHPRLLDRRLRDRRADLAPRGVVRIRAQADEEAGAVVRGGHERLALLALEAGEIGEVGGHARGVLGEMAGADADGDERVVLGQGRGVVDGHGNGHGGLLGGRSLSPVVLHRAACRITGETVSGGWFVGVWAIRLGVLGGASGERRAFLPPGEGPQQVGEAVEVGADVWIRRRWPPPPDAPPDEPPCGPRRGSAETWSTPGTTNSVGGSNRSEISSMRCSSASTISAVTRLAPADSLWRFPGSVASSAMSTQRSRSRPIRICVELTAGLGERPGDPERGLRLVDRRRRPRGRASPWPPGHRRTARWSRRRPYACTPSCPPEPTVLPRPEPATPPRSFRLEIGSVCDQVSNENERPTRTPTETARWPGTRSGGGVRHVR
jgi:hypothetical protein